MDTHHQRMEALRVEVERLQAQLVENAQHLAQAIDAAVDGAPLNQLSSALSGAIDRYLKLEQHLARPDQQDHEQVIRIEYVYPDGSVHDAPPWARDNSAESGAVSCGGVRSPLRENGGRQDSDR